MKFVIKINGRQVDRVPDTPESRRKFDDMVLSGQAPRANSDREFLMGKCNGNQFEGMERLGDHYRRVAEAHGQDVHGKVYLSGLARFPGDPEAWVSGKGDVENVLDRRGWGAEGAVSRPVTNVAPPANVAVAPDIVEDKVDEILSGVEDPGRVDREDLAEQVTDRLKPHWAQ